MNTINQALERQLELEVNMEQVHSAITDKDYRNRLGEIIYDSYLSNLKDLYVFI